MEDIALEMTESNSSFSSACHWNNVRPPPTLLASVTSIISPCALGTPKEFYNCDRSTLHISKVELAFLDFGFTPINQFAMHELGCDLPYIDLKWYPPTIVRALLHFVYMHTVFLSPGLGVYRQAQGWPMGTNAAPP